MAFSDRQVVELFHLHLLRLLAGRDKAHIALKGGCNLRLFFGSIRYSEDMDLDVAQALEPHALKEKMTSLLAGAALRTSLGGQGIELAGASAPKQTETTQRWKAELRVRGKPVSLHTKVEFSRRPKTEEAVLEAVAPSVVQAYQMLPVLLRHYPLQTAIVQKVRALVGRQAVQARDVFDLSVLFTRAGGKAEALASEQALIARAIERAMEVSYDDYQGQVVAFLDPEQASAYSSREAWDALQILVVDALQRAGR